MDYYEYLQKAVSGSQEQLDDPACACDNQEYMTPNNRGDLSDKAASTPLLDAHTAQGRLPEAETVV